MARTVMAGKWSVHRLTATVINDIAVEVAFFTLWATGLCVPLARNAEL